MAAEPPLTADEIDTILCFTARTGDVGTLVHVLQKDGAKLNLNQISRPLSPLQLAARHGHAGVVQVLLRAGADPLHPKNGVTPLHLAARNGHTSALVLLLAAVDAKQQPPKELLDFLELQIPGHRKPSSQRAVLESAAGTPADPAVETFDAFQTPLHLAAAEGHVEAVALLCVAGLSPQSHCFSGQPLHLAARAGHLAACKELLQCGADVNGVTLHRSNTALILACRHSHADVAFVLLEREADTTHANTFGQTALFWAARRGLTRVVERLVDPKLMNKATDHGGKTPLHAAAEGGHEDVVRLLLQHGASASEPAKHGELALQLAGKQRHLGVVKLLLEAGPGDWHQGAPYRSDAEQAVVVESVKSVVERVSGALRVVLCEPAASMTAELLFGAFIQTAHQRITPIV